MEKKIDFGCKSIGSYQFPLAWENSVGKLKVHLADLSFSETPIRIRIFHEDPQNKEFDKHHHGAHFTLDHRESSSLKVYKEKYGNDLPKDLIVTEAFCLDPFRSLFGEGVARNFDSEVLKNPKDTEISEETVMLKAMATQFLDGTMEMSADILACKYTNTGENYSDSYAFYFRPDEDAAFSISIKMVTTPRQSNHLDVLIPSYDMTYCFCI